MGINIGQVIAAINEKTNDFAGMQVPVKVIVDSKSKTFRIEVGSPPTSALIKKELGLQRGSSKQKLEKVGDLPIQGAVRVARMKHSNMLAADVKAATKEVIGSCVSLGIIVEGKDPREVLRAIESGDYDSYFHEGADLSYDQEAARSKSKQMAALATYVTKADLEKQKAAAEAATAAAGAPAEGAAAPAEEKGAEGKEKGKGKKAAEAKPEAKPAAKGATAKADAKPEAKKAGAGKGKK
jgi:large subunit ribosomal protein L11